MDLHIIIRPKARTAKIELLKAGSIQFNQFQGRTLRAVSTATVWWKRQYIQARASSTHSIVTIDIPPNYFSHLFHYGFSVEILKNNNPIFFSEWGRNNNIANGFFLRLNLEAIQLRQQSSDTPLAAIFTRHPGLYPTNQEVYLD